MVKHDLSFVAPERRDEVLRRIAAVERFINAPGRTAAEAAAAELGLGPAQFYNLVTAWRQLGRPEALAGSGRPKQRRLRMTVEQAAIADTVIQAGAGKAAYDLVDTIVDAAARAGVEPPPREIVARYVFRTRPAGLPSEVDGADVAIDHCVVDMPVVFDGRPATRPLATFAIDVPRQAIVGLALSDGRPGPQASAAALLDAQRRGCRGGGGTRPVRIALMAERDADWSRLEAAIVAGGGSPHRIDVGDRGWGRLAEGLLGRRSAGIALRPRLVSAGLAARAPAGWLATKPALPSGDATTLIAGRLLAPIPTGAFAGLDDVQRRILERGLSAVAQPG